MGYNSCKGICERYKKPKYTNERYGNGWKRCRECAIRIFWEGRFCPCCGYLLSTRVRSGPTRKAKAAAKPCY